MKLDLDTYLPYLIHRVGPAVERTFFDAMSSVGLNVEEWRVMAVITSRGPQNLNDLSQRTSIKVATLSRLIGRLEKRNLIKRRRVETNNREVEISLLKGGVEKAQQLIPHCLQYEKNIDAHFSECDQAHLRRLLPKLYDVLVDMEYDPAELPKSLKAKGGA